MNTVTKLTTYFTPETYQLSLTLNRTARSFHGTVTIKGETFRDNILRLHAKDILIESAHVDGRVATWQACENDEVEFTSSDMPAGTHVVTIGFSGTITDAMHGMYPCYFEHDGVKKELLATQFESHHAREVFPCIDEPAAKATFDVTLTTEPGVVVLGNMPVTLQREEDNGLVTTFATTPKMSTYLLAWVVGDLHKKTATTKSGVEVNVWATPAQPLESLDFALQFATRTVDFFDDYFGVPYPLPKCDHVALPDFSSGAMENWGLITYREIALLADPKTTSISSKHYIATVIAHELSHQWFGNLVTMKWWNDLWLNESFATLMEYIAVDALQPEWDIWLDFASHESIMALRRDATFGVQSVQVDVHHPDEISTLFDSAIVYAKGARLLRMLHHYVGEKDFREGLRQYFKRYAYQNTAADDLWSALAGTSGKDIKSFMQIWISTSGYPVLHVSGDSLSQEQFFIGPHEPTSQLWPLLLDSTDASHPELLEDRDISLWTTPGTRFNTLDASHYITHYAPGFLEPIVAQVSNGAIDATGRLQLLHEQTLLARSGTISSATLLPLLRAYREESTESVWDIMALTLGELKKFVEADEASEKALRHFAGELSETQFNRLGWDEKPAESESDTKLRATIIGLQLYSEREKIVQEAGRRFSEARTLDSLPGELRAQIIGATVRLAASPTLIERLLDAYRTTTSADVQLDICAGLTTAREPSTIAQLLTLLTDGESVRNQDVARWFAYLMRNRHARETTWQWMKDNWQWITETFSGDKSYDDYPRYAASGLITRAQLEDYRVFFAPMTNEPALKRVIELGIVEIEGRVEMLERDGEAVRRALLA